MRTPLFRGVLAATLTAALSVLLTAPKPVLAAGGGGGGLPWEAPLQTFVNSLTGPVAFAISLLGIVVCGAMLIWGGEINEFARRFVMLVLVVALLVFATNILTQLFGVGAVIAAAGAGVVLA